MATKEEMIVAVRAVQNGFIGQVQVQECMDLQRQMTEQGQPAGLMDLLVAKGYLEPRQLVFITTGDGVGLDLDDDRDRQAIDGYHIERKIGQGGMATVYQAFRQEDDRICALKILFPHHARNPKLVEGFINEGRLMMSLDHENVVRGFDTGQSSDLHYLALEYVDGVTVQDVLDKQGALSEELALEVILQIAHSLRYLSSQDITHRDIKPGNVLIDRQGVIKLCDLGFAKTAAESEGEEATTCGTVEYISPEQARGRTDVDIRSDIYSLGATLYHLVVGEVPFQGSDSMDVMAKQVRDGLSSQKVKNRNISHHMHYFIEKMMAKERDIRYDDPDEMISDIEETVAGNRSLKYDPTGNQVRDPLAEVALFFETHGPSPEDTRRRSISGRGRRDASPRRRQTSRVPREGRRSSEDRRVGRRASTSRVPRDKGRGLDRRDKERRRPDESTAKGSESTAKGNESNVEGEESPRSSTRRRPSRIDRLRGRRRRDR